MFSRVAATVRSVTWVSSLSGTYHSQGLIHQPVGYTDSNYQQYLILGSKEDKYHLLEETIICPC
jgi:hypothetical protein